MGSVEEGGFVFHLCSWVLNRKRREFSRHRAMDGFPVSWAFFD